MSVKVTEISKRYDKQLALDQVSFEINAGEVVGFLGPNGAGKSTMMKIISCYLPQTSGSVSVAGFDVMEDPISVRKCVGYLPEHNPLYLDMYVKEFLNFVGGLQMDRKLVPQRVKEMVEMTGLGDEQHKKIGALSKGYRQRVGLAQSMIHNPDVLILDEPTTGLDPNQLVEIRQLIKTIGKEKTVILSTHIMQEVEAICNRVLIINKGKIVADDATGILQKKSGKLILAVSFDKEIEISAFKQISGVVNIVSKSNNTYHFELSDGVDIRPTLNKMAYEKGLTITALNQQTSSIESIFRELTK